MSYHRVELIDYTEYNWNIDVFYKNQYIDSLNREEFQKLIGMLAISTWIFDRKYGRTFHPDRCELTHPFEVNAHMYVDQQLSSLRILLNNQHDKELEAWMKSTLDFEKEQYEIFRQASSIEEFEEYMKYLNNDENVLKLRLKELNVKKIVDLKFIKNIDLIYDEYIEQLNTEKERLPEYYEDPDSWANQKYNFSLNFREKYKAMMKKIDSFRYVN